MGIGMKKLLVFILMLSLLLCVGCTNTATYDVVATTLPVYEFTAFLCQGTDITTGLLVTENVSCLHDYTLKVDQMRMIEDAEIVVISGAGLEDFLEDVLYGKSLIDTSVNVHIRENGQQHDHEHHKDHGHNHENDPHIWLAPENAKVMAGNICSELSKQYPNYQEVFQQNLSVLQNDLNAFKHYGDIQLSDLRTRNLVTFHDGFAYFAESFDLTILEAIEEESGSEASAEEIIHLIQLVNNNALPAVFVERSGSDACAGIIQAETGAKIYTLDMSMAGNSYFDAMYHNIDTIKEALG